MLAIEVEFLMGRAVLARLDERDVAEWPPHPQRLFSALLAAQSELAIGATGEAALEWLESLPPPDIRAELFPSFRQTHRHWVPVNYEAMKAHKGQIDFRHPLDRRGRQGRFFPAVVLSDPTVVFQWSQAAGIEKHRTALTELVENLSYLGHSTSPVRACLRSDLVEPTLRPSSGGGGRYSLRVPGPGRLAQLKTVHRSRLKDRSVQPPTDRVVRYQAVKKGPHTVFSPDALVVTFESGPRLGLGTTLPLLQHFRDAVLSRLETAAPAALSGHDSEGRPTAEPHLAYVPLGFVNSQYADGSLQGIALVLPRGVEQDVRSRLNSAIEDPWQLHLGVLGSLSLRLNDSDRFAPYIGRSRTWATVTPIVLDRHPKKKGPTAESIIAESCARIGLPNPIEVRVGEVSAIRGCPRVQDVHGQSKQTEGRLLQHVVLHFSEAVSGPILLGAGRFTGLGLCMPFGK